jgi:toxin CcdB
MPEFALHALQGGGLVVDVQSDLLEPFTTRVVIPLVAIEHAPQAPRRLNPVIEVAGAPLILAAHLLAALPRAEIGPAVGSLAHERDRIRAALDMLFLGF